MNAIGFPESTVKPRGVLVGASSPVMAREFARELVCYARTSPISIATEFSQLKSVVLRCRPAVAVVEEDILPRPYYLHELRSLAAKLPVILIADSDRHCDFRRLIAEGNLDLVSRDVASVAIAVSLVERRLRWSASAIGTNQLCLAADSPENLGEIFRHEINNPLTGILGNAELLLLHRKESLSEIETQRLQTVVQLAVRLRETIRRLSQSLETSVPAAKSA